ncbi:MAG: hypothetical protein ACLT5P_09000 [Flavonifractor plautii]
MKVYLIGVGMGNPATLTGQALEAIGDSPVLVGAPACWSPGRRGTTASPTSPRRTSPRMWTRPPGGRWGCSSPATPDFTAGPRGCGPCWGTTR